MIYLEPMGGLANRIRVIATAIALKRRLNTQLAVIWNQNHELNCAFHLLFQPIAEFNIIPKKPIYNYLSADREPGFKNKVANKAKNFMAGIDAYLTDKDVTDTDVYAIIRSYKNVYIKACQCLNGEEETYRLFKPVAKIESKINQLSHQLHEHTFAVQIRRTDNSTAIENSPVELFIEHMRAEVEINPKTNFFLATDDSQVEALITAEFPGKVITRPKDLSRTTVAGMQDACADLFTMARTSKIFGSYWSSFSEVAAIIGQIPLEVIKR